MAAILEAVTEALEIIVPGRPATQARTLRSHDAMRCDVPCHAMPARCERCDCDTKRTSGNLFPPFHRSAVDHLVLFKRRHSGRVWWRASRAQKGWGDCPWLMGKGFLCFVPRPCLHPPTHSLCCYSAGLGVSQRPCSHFLRQVIFCQVRSAADLVLIGIAPTSWFRGLER